VWEVTCPEKKKTAAKDHQGETPRESDRGRGKERRCLWKEGWGKGRQPRGMRIGGISGQSKRKRGEKRYRKQDSLFR